MKTFIQIIKENIGNIDRIWDMAKADQKKRFRGSDMGMLWAFIKPTMYIVVFYLAISIGFKSSKNIPGIETPYFIWLTIGMISFFYMRDMILNGAACFRKYGQYITNAKFPVSILPATVSVSYMIIHFVMLGIGFAICLIFGVMPSIYWVQIPFYMILMFIISVFWGIASGLISVLYRDFYNLLQVINQAVFWLSAILFDLRQLDPIIQKVFLFNPISYIVEGYRNAICRHIWFWEEPEKLICYLLMLVVMIVIAILMYKKLRKRIPDII